MLYGVDYCVTRIEAIPWTVAGLKYCMVGNFGVLTFMKSQRKPSELSFMVLDFMIATVNASTIVAQ